MSMVEGWQEITDRSFMDRGYVYPALTTVTEDHGSVQSEFGKRSKKSNFHVNIFV